MLKILKGNSAEERLKVYASQIEALVANGESVVVIIPDQFSFEFDRRLYDKLGAKNFNKVTVLSFKRYCQDLIQHYGTESGTLINNGERTIITYSVLNEIKKTKSLKVFNRLLDKPAFVNEIVRLCDSLARFGATAPSLRSCLPNLNGTLQDKVSDIADIYEAYLKALAERDLRDESSVISIGSKIANAERTFWGKYVFIDRFDSFSNDEFDVIESALRFAKCVTVCLDAPDKAKGYASTIWDICRLTENRICEIAQGVNLRPDYQYVNVLSEKPRDLMAFDLMLSGNRNTSADNSGNLSVVSATSVYDEAEFIAATVRKCILNGYKYNDISCITRDIATYAPALEAAFERYGIPYFIDAKTPASSLSVSTYCFAIIDAVSTRKPNTERILRLVNSPFSNLSDDEASLIEDYCVRWNVEGEMWLSDFTVCERENLERINGIRKKIIEPLWALHQACQNATGKQVASSYNKYIDNCKLSSKAKSIIDSFVEPAEKLASARLFKQLWNKMMGAVADIYNTIGDEKLTAKGFGELLRLILLDSGISNPPQKLDTVSVFDSSRSVIVPNKIVFAMGVNDGKFPMDIKKTGIFNGRDTRKLEAVGLSFEAGELSRQKEEQLNCYRALTSATEKLYITYTEADTTGRPSRPSKYAKYASKICGTAKTADYSLEYFASTPASAFYRYAISSDSDVSERQSVLNALKTVPEYKEKLELLEKSAKPSEHKLDSVIAKNIFAYSDISISPTKIDQYNKCAYKYFLNYGLGLEKIKPLSLSADNRGSIMHHVFEYALRHFGDAFDTATDAEIRQFVSTTLSDYARDKMGGDFGKSASYKANYNRFEDACCEILFNIREEYKVSKFRPARYEYNLIREDESSVLTLPVRDGVSIKIRGIVDRVDIYTADDGKKYIRILDYKTGKKKLEFCDIYNGLNLQLLFYMLALTEGSDADFNNCIPAGVLYMPAGFLNCSAVFNAEKHSEINRSDRVAVSLKRSGLVTDEDDIVEAMDKNVKGIFAPVARKKDGSYKKESKIIPEESLVKLSGFARKKLLEFANNLLDGNIDPNPCSEYGKNLPCTYCEFYAICDKPQNKSRAVTKEDGEKLKEEIGISEDYEYYNDDTNGGEQDA